MVRWDRTILLPIRAAKNTHTGEIFIECPDEFWQIALNEKKKDPKAPSPMPTGHIMFDGDGTYYQAGWWRLGQWNTQLQ